MTDRLTAEAREALDAVRKAATQAVAFSGKAHLDGRLYSAIFAALENLDARLRALESRI